GERREALAQAAEEIDDRWAGPALGENRGCQRYPPDGVLAKLLTGAGPYPEAVAHFVDHGVGLNPQPAQNVCTAFALVAQPLQQFRRKRQTRPDGVAAEPKVSALAPAHETHSREQAERRR